MKMKWIKTFNTFLELLKTHNVRKTRIVLTPGFQRKWIDEKHGIEYPGTMVRLSAHLKDIDTRIYLEQWFDDEEVIDIIAQLKEISLKPETRHISIQGIVDMATSMREEQQQEDSSI